MQQQGVTQAGTGGKDRGGEGVGVGWGGDKTAQGKGWEGECLRRQKGKRRRKTTWHRQGAS